MRTSLNASFYGHPELEAVRLLHALLQEPSAYPEHLESFVSRVTCRLAWGDSRASEELKQRARELLITVSPTGHLGNKLPFIMALPSFLCKAKTWEVRRARTERTWFETMQSQVRHEIEEGKAGPSWMKSFLMEKGARNDRTSLTDDVAGAYCVGMNGIAGALTIAAPMQSLLLALCLYPQHLAKLHEELDRECPIEPPRYSDLARLPRLRAALRETIRWRPPVPTGIPHELTQDDVWNGYCLPKGSVMHPLEWSMGRAAELFAQPERWDPDRWLDPASPVYREPLSTFPTITGCTQFGFGRRVCPGQQVSEADLFVGMGSVLWAFDVGRQVDVETGLEVFVPACDYSSLLIAKPYPFAVRIATRNRERQRWIERRFAEEQAAGSFPDARQYWDAQDQERGWGETWS